MTFMRLASIGSAICAVVVCAPLAACGSLGLGGVSEEAAPADPDRPSVWKRIIDGDFAPAGSRPSIPSTVAQPATGDAAGAARNPRDEPDCPFVDILPNSAAIQARAGDVVRHQIAIYRVARECREVPGGLAVRVGVEGRVLLGRGGAPGTFAIPLRFEARRGETIVASRSERLSATVPVNDTQTVFTVVAQEMVIPNGPGDAEISVGLGDVGPQPRSARRR